MIKKSIKNKLKEYFFQNPSLKLRVRQIEREVGIPLPSAIRYVKELEKENILKSSKIANIIVYSADRSSKNFLLEKKLFNLKQLYSSGLIDFIVEEFSNPTMILFGSYSKGEDLEESDIDLYIETNSKKKIHFEKHEKKLQRKIQCFVYRNIEKVENKKLANNIVNGVTLNGFVEVFR